MRGGPRVSRYQIRAALIFISQPKMRLLTPCCHMAMFQERPTGAYATEANGHGTCSPTATTLKILTLYRSIPSPQP